MSKNKQDKQKKAEEPKEERTLDMRELLRIFSQHEPTEEEIRATKGVRDEDSTGIPEFEGI